TNEFSILRTLKLHARLPGSTLKRVNYSNSLLGAVLRTNNLNFNYVLDMHDARARSRSLVR
ncbi:hypothetical protein LINPERHAP1_LOCUS34906, partial [Linum perenne]